MKEQQGYLSPRLSGLPGPRPFNKKNKKGISMEDKNKQTIDDIVSKTTEALRTGKGFGGWTDTIEEDAYKRHVKKQHASREREKKEIEAEKNKEEPLVIHGPDGTRKNPQYSKFIYPKKKKPKYKIVHDYDKDGNMSTRYEKESAEVDERMEEDYIDQKPDGMWCVYDDDGEIIKEFKTKSEAEDFLGEAIEEQQVKIGRAIPMKLGAGVAAGTITAGVEHDGEFLGEKVITNSDGTKVKVLTPEQKKRHNLPRSKKDATTRPNFPRPRGTKWWKTDEEVATQPRQLKDKKKEMLVHDKKGKVKTIDKKDLEQYQKDNPGSGVAEGLGSMLGGAIGSVVPGVGTMVGAEVGGLAGKMFKKKKQPGEESKT